MALFTPNIAKQKSKRNTKGLIKALTHESAEIKKQAAQALGKLYAREAVNPLLLALTDWDDGVRIAAAEALGKIGKTKALAPLTKALKENNPKLKKTVINALAEFGVDAINPLINLLVESDEKTQDDVAKALIKIGDLALKQIKTLLFSDNYEHRASLLKVYTNIGDDEAIEILLELINNDSEYEIRQAAAQHLLDLGESAVPKILETAIHPNSDLMLMLNILSKIGNASCREFFKENLQSSDAKIRMMAASGLENSGWQPRKDELGVWFYIAKKNWNLIPDFGLMAINPLGKVIEDKDEIVRAAALDVLGQIGETGVDALIKSLNESHPALRLQAAAALGKLKDTKAINALSHCLKDEDARVRRAAVESLGRIEDLRCVNPIIMALKDDDAEVRKIAIKYVYMYEDPRGIELFSRMLADPAPVVAQEAVRVLVQTGEPVVEAVIDVLNDPNSISKRYAATTLGALGAKQAVPPLLDLLKHNNWIVRKSAVIALGQIGDKRAASGLAELLSDREEVAFAAAQGLANLGKPAVFVLLPMLLRGKQNPFVIMALKEMRDEAIMPLITILRHPDTQLRSTAVKILDMIGWKPAKDEAGAAYWIAKREWDKGVEVGDQAVDPLIEVLADEEIWNRKEAAQHLGEFKNDKAVDSLIISLSDKYWNVREAAMQSLVKMGRKAVEPLIEAMLTGSKEGFEQIAATLANIGDRRAIAPLVYVLKDRRRFVRLSAARALEKLKALEGEKRCQHCGKIVHKTLGHGDLCPFCNLELDLKHSAEALEFKS